MYICIIYRKAKKGKHLAYLAYIFNAFFSFGAIWAHWWAHWWFLFLWVTGHHLGTYQGGIATLQSDSVRRFRFINAPVI